MKAVWKGYVGFGLVNIPISLYSAVDQDRISFRLLHDEDKAPITYKRFCTECGKEVDWGDIVKGLEVGKNEYYVFTKKEIEELKPEAGDMIEIKEFVNKEELEWIYLNKHYFLGSQKGAERSFNLLKRVMGDTNKIAIAKFVMREKEYVCAIYNYKKGFLLSILNYENEIRDIENVPNIGKETELKDREIELAEELIDKLTNKHLSMDKYEDTFTEKLKEVVKEGVVEHIEKGKKVQKTENLIESLEASIGSK